MNIANKTIFCKDNLDVLRGIDSETIDMIYLDPPFNSKKDWFSPIGSAAKGAGFKDTWGPDDFKEEWFKAIEGENLALYELLDFAKKSQGRKPSNFYYLVYISVRLIEMRRVLKNTGSIYLHCDQTMSHYLKLVLDCIFGAKNFRNEIVWKRTSTKSLSIRKYAVNQDYLLYYSKSTKYVWNQQYEDYGEAALKSYNKEDKLGKYATGDLSGGKGGSTSAYDSFSGVLPPKGRAWAPPTRDKFPAHAKIPHNYEQQNPLDKCYMLEKAGLIYRSKSGKPYYKKYLAMAKGIGASSIITNIPPAKGKQNTGYKTQKPTALLHRIIKASTNEGDFILDPFCGCATTCVAAEQLGRQWAGIDVSQMTYDFIRERLKKDAPETVFSKTPITYTHEPPIRDKADKRATGFVYIIANPVFEGCYKVGISSNPDSRLKQYQTSDPKRGYQLQYKFETPDYSAIEAAVHEEFENEHEWVRADLADIQKFIESYQANSPSKNPINSLTT